MDYIFKLSIPESTCSLIFKVVSQLSIKLVYGKLGLPWLPQVGGYPVVGGFPVRYVTTCGLRKTSEHQQKFISLLMRWRHVLTYLTPFPASLASRAS